jgi:hypothetical protein
MAAPAAMAAPTAMPILALALELPEAAAAELLVPEEPPELAPDDPLEEPPELAEEEPPEEEPPLPSPPEDGGCGCGCGLSKSDRKKQSCEKDSHEKSSAVSHPMIDIPSPSCLVTEFFCDSGAS